MITQFAARGSLDKQVPGSLPEMWLANMLYLLHLCPAAFGGLAAKEALEEDVEEHTASV
jgi:hypothetical protein